MIKVQTKNKLVNTPLQGQLIAFLEKTLNQSLPQEVLKAQIKKQGNRLIIQSKTYHLSDYKNIYIIGFGKSSADMAISIKKLLGNKIKEGIVISGKEKDARLKFIKGTHPYGSLKNVQATKQIETLAHKGQSDDLVLVLISGGGSAFLCHEILPIAKQKALLKDLFKKGASIEQINLLRKHLSLIKRGNLAKMIYPATVVNLIISDVTGNDLSDIASGPTVKDKSTKAQAIRVARKLKLRLPVIETPKESKYFLKTNNHLIFSRQDLLKLAQKQAEKAGFKVKVIGHDNHGDTQTVLDLLWLNSSDSQHDLWIGCGESTVYVKGRGVGGRNLELCARAISKIAQTPDKIFIAINTDGKDGNSPSAGAMVHEKTLQKVKNSNLKINQYLVRNDTYKLLKKLNALIVTGETGVNVSDLFIIAKRMT